MNLIELMKESGDNKIFVVLNMEAQILFKFTNDCTSLEAYNVCVEHTWKVMKRN